jgi:DNA-binding MurR/RpiR family transcriptional regulator
MPALRFKMAQKPVNTHPEDPLFAGRLIDTKIVGSYPALGTAERRVADYILAHPHEITGLAIAALAGRCQVSQHTINRFCRSVGLAGYPELKLALAQHLILAASSLSQDGSAPTGPDGVIAQAFHFNINSIKATAALGQNDTLRAVAKQIAHARLVRFFGMGGSAVVCMDAALRLRQLGIATEAVLDPYNQTVEACWIGKRDIAIGISHTGASRPTVEALRLARASAAATVAITNFPDSPLAKSADQVLLTATGQQLSTLSTTMMVSRLAQLALVDALYALVALERAKQVGAPADRIDAAVEANLRI